MRVTQIVFACYSKACAPPPVGKGGSSAGGNIFTGEPGYRARKVAKRRAHGGSVYKIPNSEQIHGKLGSHFGKGIDSVFQSGSLIIPNPFPSARRSRNDPKYFNQEHVEAEMRKPVQLRSVDPRTLSSMQSGMTRPGVQYYLSPEYARTGKTYADGGSRINQYPTVYHKKSTGELILLSGNHRAMADLVSGKMTKARIIESP